jgi:hypothetical protein
VTRGLSLHYGCRIRRVKVNCEQLTYVSLSLDRPTTITVTERTRRLLQSVKGDRESFDDMIQGMLEDTFFDDAFYQEIERRWLVEKRVPGRRVMKRAGLA